MIKKILSELTQKFKEEFFVEISKNKVEFFSENHLFIFDMKKEQLIQKF